jgi:hypothetical protein
MNLPILPSEQLQINADVLDKLPVYYKHYLGDNTHFEPRYGDDSNKAKNAEKVLEARSKEGDPKNEKPYDDKKLANGKSMVFQFRLKNLVGQANKERVYYIETRTKDKQYGPSEAQFITAHDNAPVISEWITFTNANGNNAAMGMQVVKQEVEGLPEDKATSNEATVAENVKVISGEGAVTILNAAGKTVTVTNVLGQTIAKTVVSSDNATIALPKGIVVVSIDGESAKAVVK